MTFLLDTCVLSEMARPRPEPRVVSWFERTAEDDLALSALTIGEIRFGIARRADGRERRRLSRWLAALEKRFADRVLPVDALVASTWGELRADAARRGTPLPVVDGLIAATAVVNRLTLVTRDHPRVVDAGLSVLDPWTLAASEDA